MNTLYIAGTKKFCPTKMKKFTMYINRTLIKPDFEKWSDIDKRLIMQFSLKQDVPYEYVQLQQNVRIVFTRFLQWKIPISKTSDKLIATWEDSVEEIL